PKGIGKWQVSANGGVNPAWSGDGRELFFFERYTLMRAAVSTRNGFSVDGPKPLFQVGNLGFASFDVAPDGKRFVIVEPVEQSTMVTRSIHLIQNWYEAVRGRQNAGKQ